MLSGSRSLTAWRHLRACGAHGVKASRLGRNRNVRWTGCGVRWMGSRRQRALDGIAAAACAGRQADDEMTKSVRTLSMWTNFKI